MEKEGGVGFGMKFDDEEVRPVYVNCRMLASEKNLTKKPPVGWD